MREQSGADGVDGPSLGDEHPSDADRDQPLESSGAAVDPVEAALAGALKLAAEAAQWTAVEQLSRELEARRKARAGTVDLAAERARREKR